MRTVAGLLCCIKKLYLFFRFSDTPTEFQPAMDSPNPPQQCGICRSPGAINLSAMPAQQQGRLRTAAGHGGLAAACTVCIDTHCNPPSSQNLVPNPVHTSWTSRSDGLWHAANDPDTPPGADPVARKFINKGEKEKGDGVHRLFCAGIKPEAEVEAEGKCKAWRRLACNPLTGPWSYTQYAERVGLLTVTPDPNNA
jgi:hypothetical protein